MYGYISSIDATYSVHLDNEKFKMKECKPFVCLKDEVNHLLQVIGGVNDNLFVFIYFNANKLEHLLKVQQPIKLSNKMQIKCTYQQETHIHQ